VLQTDEHVLRDVLCIGQRTRELIRKPESRRAVADVQITKHLAVACAQTLDEDCVTQGRIGQVLLDPHLSSLSMVRSERMSMECSEVADTYINFFVGIKRMAAPQECS
jgi:hypothetical protein